MHASLLIRGKFAQSLDKTTTSFIDNFSKLLRLLKDETLNVTSIRFASRKCAVVTYETKSGYRKPHKMHNPCLAAMVTSWGRCMLWKAASKLGTDLAYMDTDRFGIMRSAPFPS